jgi:hypothetical protein
MLIQRYTVKIKKHLPVFALCSTLFISYLSLPASSSLQVKADTVSNENYSIDVNTIDTDPGPTPKAEILGTRTVQIKQFTTGPNYTVNASNDSLAITLSQNTIDYGILSSTNPVIRTSGISFSNPAAGAEVLAYENNPPQSALNDTIPNTTCDNGLCSPLLSAVWTNTLTYGFGYRCDSKDTACDPQFGTSNYFKQYATESDGQPLIILSSTKRSGTTNATITDKINISGTQKAGGYYNSITYLAVPNF